MPRNKLKIKSDWSWDAAVARNFDNHVREQLPWYSLATGIVAHIAKAYVPRNGVVIDVGASTGNIGRALEPVLAARDATLVPFDASKEMADVYRGPGELLVADATSFPFASYAPDLIVCFLSLMFVPVAQRSGLIAEMKRAVRPGGALVVFDKMIPRPGYVGTVAYRLTLSAKMEAGATPAEVVAKELSIAGVQRPLSDGEMEGFSEVFRFGDFAGWVLEH